MTIKRITRTTTLPDIRAMLRDDGYTQLLDHASEIRRAALSGTLLWTRERLTTTDASRIDVRPSASEDGRPLDDGTPR